MWETAQLVKSEQKANAPLESSNPFSGIVQTPDTHAAQTLHFLDRQGHILSSYQLPLLRQPQCSWRSRANLLPPRIWPAVFFLTASLKRYMMFCRARLICSWGSTHCSACRPYHPSLSPALARKEAQAGCWWQPSSSVDLAWDCEKPHAAESPQEDGKQPWLWITLETNDSPWVNSWKWHGTVKCDKGFYPRAMESLTAPPPPPFHAILEVC